MRVLKFGTKVPINDKEFICVKVEERRGTEFSERSSSEIHSHFSSGVRNIECWDLQLDEFEKFEPVEFEVIIAQLEIPSKDIYFIYTKYHVRRLKQDERESSSTTSDEGL